MNARIMFITAGEWPAQKGLLVSQVYETARALQARGYQDSWFASVPLLSYLKRRLLRDKDLAAIEASCRENGISFARSIAPVTLGSPFSMPLRRWWHLRLARQALRHLSAQPGAFDATVVHGRSYYAAEIGVLLRDLMAAQGTGTTIASFDMRSFLGPEAPMSHGAFGMAIYGFLKSLEYDLIRRSDASFLPVNVGRRQYREETGLEILYAPIQGMEREPGWSVDFDRRWSTKRIGYSGSIGQWHDPNLLKAIFQLFPALSPKLASKKIDALAGYECKLYKPAELADYYDGLLALVIPGLAQIDGYYRTLQMRCNLFSTKAAEALSRGVPLIVSSELQELADFVRTHDCGIVVEVRQGRPALPLGLAVDDREFWHRLSVNAAAVGTRFTRQAVIDIYEKAWLAAVAGRRAGADNSVQRTQREST
jgi:hypothetical protein